MKIIIVGAGKLGHKIASIMLNRNADVTMVDINPEVLNRINEQLDVLTVRAHGGRVDVLEKLNVKACDWIIATTNSDETNVMICSIAKKLGCPKAIARVSNPAYADQLDFIKDKLDIDYIINPELATANRIARYLIKNYAFYSGEYADGKVSVVEFNVRYLPEFAGKRLIDLDHMENLTIVAIARSGESIVPHGRTILKESDTLYVIGKKENIARLAEARKNKNGSKFSKKPIRRAMIFGGGETGYYLARRLTELGISVKLIEEDGNRCMQLAERLENVLVVHGAGTDIDLLEDEGLASMDAFISVTARDEDNLFMTIRAKQLHVDKVIAKVNRKDHKHAIEKLGIDMAMNPVEISAGDVVRHIRGVNVVSVSYLLGGHAEITEIDVPADAPFVGKTISGLRLPKGIIIGAMLRDNETIIPNGETIIHAEDRLVIFCLLSQVRKLEKFFKLK